MVETFVIVKKKGVKKMYVNQKQYHSNFQQTFFLIKSKDCVKDHPYQDEDLTGAFEYA